MSRGGSVSKLLYVHDPSQPRAPGLDTDFKITVTNQRYLSLTKLDDDQRHDFRLAVAEPLSLGLPALDDYHGDEFMKHVAMACNLVMDKAAFSPSSSDPSHVEIRMGNPPPTTSKIEVTPTMIKATVVEYLPPMRDSASLKILYSEELDESQALDALRKIRAVFDTGGNPPLKIHNLQKSLYGYLAGTQSTDVYKAFEGMYESLELATNFDKPNRVGGGTLTLRSVSSCVTARCPSKA